MKLDEIISLAESIAVKERHLAAHRDAVDEMQGVIDTERERLADAVRAAVRNEREMHG